MSARAKRRRIAGKTSQSISTDADGVEKRASTTVAFSGADVASVATCQFPEPDGGMTSTQARYSATPTWLTYFTATGPTTIAMTFTKR